MKGSVEERFWSKVDKSAGPDGCWLGLNVASLVDSLARR